MTIKIKFNKKKERFSTRIQLLKKPRLRFFNHYQVQIIIPKIVLIK